MKGQMSASTVVVHSVLLLSSRWQHQRIRKHQDSKLPNSLAVLFLFVPMAKRSPLILLKKQIEKAESEGLDYTATKLLCRSKAVVFGSRPRKALKTCIGCLLPPSARTVSRKR